MVRRFDTVDYQANLNPSNRERIRQRLLPLVVASPLSIPVKFPINR